MGRRLGATSHLDNAEVKCPVIIRGPAIKLLRTPLYQVELLRSGALL
jgi:hypothetical protein